MMKIESINIENFRGIRELTLEPNRKSFAIQGPNASGKSCVVDAIEFALTGNLSRLAGEGTGGLSVGSHAMHVDSRKNPSASKVSLRLYHSRSKEVFTITRSMDNPSQPKLKPDTPATRAALAQFSKRDEITLTRRQIAKYVLTPAAKRSADVQNLLRLGSIGTTQRAMASAEKKCQTAATAANKEWRNSQELFNRHFQVAPLNSDSILEVINQKRALLGSPSLQDLETKAFLDPVTEGHGQLSNKVVRLTALRDLMAFRDACRASKFVEASQSILESLQELERDPKLSFALRANKLFELGLELAEENSCPLCESPKSLNELRAHFARKLELSQRAAQIGSHIDASANELQDACFEVISASRPIMQIAKDLDREDIAQKLMLWTNMLQTQSDTIRNRDGITNLGQVILEIRHLLEHNIDLGDLDRAIECLPDQSVTLEANDFLRIAAERFGNVRIRQADKERTQSILDRAQFVHKTYSEISQAELESLYQSVEKQFADAYRSLHHEDESEFSAKLTPDEGRLELDVEFFGRGMFPPGAYHSEGHQDSMGLCLYLALMQQVFGDELRLVVLDDVVMSVDSGHRRAICELLKNRFSDTQFIITTHEEVWFHQMQTVGLIDRKNARMFESWSVDYGPVVSNAVETWGQIEAYLNKGDVPSASLALRRHLERVFPQIADSLAASAPFRIDGKHNVGELKTGCYICLKETLEKAIEVAKGWQDETKMLEAKGLLKTLVALVSGYDKESKYVTASIHENAWAKLVKEDFIPVVQAFKKFLACFQCPRCGEWLARTPRQSSKKFGCSCGKTHFTLSKPSAEQRATLLSNDLLEQKSLDFTECEIAGD